MKLSWILAVVASLTLAVGAVAEPPPAPAPQAPAQLAPAPAAGSFLSAPPACGGPALTKLAPAETMTPAVPAPTVLFCDPCSDCKLGCRAIGCICGYCTSCGYVCFC